VSANANTFPLLVSVDVETNGPCPGEFALVSIGAVVIEPELGRTFYCEVSPPEGSVRWLPKAYEVNGVSRDAHLVMPAPDVGMASLESWLGKIQSGEDTPLVLVSDNLAFDWQFISYYCWRYLNYNPFGYWGLNIPDIARGMSGVLDVVVPRRDDWKKLRRTPHTHHALDDARGNAEAMLALLARN